MEILKARKGELLIFGTFDNTLGIIEKIFRIQSYKVEPYNRDNLNRLKATKLITIGKKWKGRIRFSIIKEKNRIVHIEVHKDRFINGSFVSGHNNGNAKREMNRIQGIIARTLEVEEVKKGENS